VVQYPACDRKVCVLPVCYPGRLALNFNLQNFLLFKFRSFVDLNGNMFQGSFADNFVVKSDLMLQYLCNMFHMTSLNISSPFPVIDKFWY